jgi:hypothetical protein
MVWGFCNELAFQHKSLFGAPDLSATKVRLLTNEIVGYLETNGMTINFNQLVLLITNQIR